MASTTLASLEAVRSELVNSKYYLNIRSGYMAPVTLHCSYGDSGQTITFYIFDGGQEFNLDGSAAAIHGTRRDGANFGPFSCTVSGNSVSFTLQSSMTAVEGSAIAEITFSKSGTTVGTTNFGILVENAAFPNGVAYDTDPSVYQDILKYVQGLAGNITADLGGRIAQEGSARAMADANINNSITNLSTRVDNIVAQSGDSNTEIVDARTGQDGTVYTSIGEAVRTQTLDVNSRIDAYRNPPIEVEAVRTTVKTGTGTYTKISKGVYNFNLVNESGSTFCGCTARLGKFGDFVDGSYGRRGSRFIHLVIENTGSTLIKYTDIKLLDYAKNVIADWNPIYYPYDEYRNISIYPGETKDFLLDLIWYAAYVNRYDEDSPVQNNKYLGVGVSISGNAVDSARTYNFNISFYEDNDDNLYHDTFNRSQLSINAGYEIPQKSFLYVSNTDESNITVYKTFGRNGDLQFNIKASSLSYESGRYKYGAVGFDVSEYFGKNCSFVIDVAQTGVYSNFYLSDIQLSTNPTSWGPAYKLIDLSSYTKNQLNYTVSIPLDNIGYDYSLISSPVYLDFGCMLYSGSTISLATFTITPYVVYNDARIIGSEDTSTDIVFWGDSLTAGAGGSGTTYPNVCCSELNCDHINCGVGGETANTIAARQGGNSIILSAGAVNRTLSLNDLTDIFGYHVNPLRQGNGSGSGSSIVVNGKTCNLAITQSSSTSTDATYTISGYTGSNLTVPTVARFAGCIYTGKITVIWVGQNGSTVNGVSDSLDARIAIIDSMIAHVHNKRYVVLGLSSGTESERAAEDLKLLQKYGVNFFPTRRLLVQNGLTLARITPTSQDNTDIAAGTVPTSLRSDYVHLNASGYTALGKMLAQKIRSLGFDEYL